MSNMFNLCSGLGLFGLLVILVVLILYFSLIKESFSNSNFFSNFRKIITMPTFKRRSFKPKQSNVIKKTQDTHKFRRSARNRVVTHRGDATEGLRRRSPRTRGRR